MTEDEATKVEDIAMLCANCHRMIHRKPMISVNELRVLVAHARER
jgi:5-methylcytosine-specific restriction enzyme A